MILFFLGSRAKGAGTKWIPACAGMTGAGASAASPHHRLPSPSRPPPCRSGASRDRANPTTAQTSSSDLHAPPRVCLTAVRPRDIAP
ncbi:hypothetical protein GLE_1145 [Lysobacter enzymogenes]|uniref:Uncharacterized protein n=1 Tax=Lysobacter enzymogenes TaxID=69 RepID=A0A0S2DDD8_LYSEN|nr:hypothetical protein GLE_1145 [Lysobacter enzymogenes]